MRDVKLGTGKTHTLIEIIRQLTSASTSNSKAKRVLVCGASNLSVDNILERLLALPVPDKAAKLKVTRIGHPARVMSHEGVLDSTLDVKATRTDQVSVKFWPPEWKRIPILISKHRQPLRKM